MTPNQGHLRVYQGGRLIGYLPGLPQRSNHAMFDIRPGDFKMDDLGDGPVIIAHNSIGSGDFACIPGFETVEGREIRSTAIEAYDKLAKEAEMDRVIDKLVKEGPPNA